MSSMHKYGVGQSVRLSASAGLERGASGPYKVVAQLPEERGDWQYRIQSSDRTRERVARESQLSAIEPS